MKFLLFCVIIVIQTFRLYPQSYLMSLENIKKVEANKIEFEVFINSSSGNLFLESYQAALKFNQSISDGNLSFSYIPGSSELSNVPTFGIGIYNRDGVPKIAFASNAGNDTINISKKRIGKFRLISTTIFNSSLPNFEWSFDGSVSTIVAGNGFIDLTEIQSHKVLLNSPPAFTSVLTDRNVFEGDTLQFFYSAFDPDNEVLTYSINSITPVPSGSVVINSSTGKFVFIPSSSDVGKIFTVIVRVSDGTTFAASEPALISVQIKSIPAFTSVLENATVRCNDTLYFPYIASDPDGNPLSYSVGSVIPQPEGSLVLLPQGLLMYIASPGDAGKIFSLIIKASNGVETIYSPIALINVLNINNPPVFVSVIKDTAIQQGDTLRFNYSAIDQDGDELHYLFDKIEPFFNGLKLINDSTGMVTLIPSVEDAEKYFLLSIKVTDGTNTTISEPVIFNVSKLNLPPSFTSVLPDQVLTGGDTLKFKYTAADPDEDNLLFTIKSIYPAYAGYVSMDSLSGLFTFIPCEINDIEKTFLFNVNVFDGKNDVTTSVKVTVTKINSSPKFLDWFPSVTVYIRDTLAFVFSAVDDDDDKLIYSFAITPGYAGYVKLDSTSGLFNFIPSQHDAGKIFILQVFATDEKNGSDSIAAIIKVEKKNQRPRFISVLSDKNILQGDTLKFTYSAADDDNDTLTYSVNSEPQPEGLLKINELSGELIFIPSNKDINRSFSIYVNVTDGIDSLSSEEVLISVGRKNIPPSFIAAVTDTAINYIDTLRIIYEALDEDDDLIFYHLEIIKETAEEDEISISGLYHLDSLSGLFTLIPSKEDTGKTFRFCIIACDGIDTVFSKPVNILIKEFNITSVSDEQFANTYRLQQNYPNPFNPQTKIRFTLEMPGFVSLFIYDVLGKQIASLVNEEKPAGGYEVYFDGSEFASGVYIYTIIANTIDEKCFTASKKMILTK